MQLSRSRHSAPSLVLLRADWPPLPELLRRRGDVAPWTSTRPVLHATVPLSRDRGPRDRPPRPLRRPVTGRGERAWPEGATRPEITRHRPAPAFLAPAGDQDAAVTSERSLPHMSCRSSAPKSAAGRRSALGPTDAAAERRGAAMRTSTPARPARGSSWLAGEGGIAIGSGPPASTGGNARWAAASANRTGEGAATRSACDRSGGHHSPTPAPAHERSRTH